MAEIFHPSDPDREAERAQLEAAVALARADDRYVSHEDMRVWLMELAAGNFAAARPPLQQR